MKSCLRKAHTADLSSISGIDLPQPVANTFLDTFEELENDMYPRNHVEFTHFTR